MRYIPGHNNTNARLAEALPTSRPVFVEDAPLERAEKWPLWWTVLGLSVFCGAFWATLISLIV